jgi:putative SOS response-associated peptidase YedK
MPVILNTEDYYRWLDPHSPSASIEVLLTPFLIEGIVTYRVSNRINNSRCDAPRRIQAGDFLADKSQIDKSGAQ